MTDFCNKCNSDISYDRYVFDLDIDDNNVFNIKEELLKNMFLKDFCKQCHSTLDKTFEFQDYLALKPILENTVITLSKISETVELNQKTFFLAGVIAFTPPSLKNSPKHYIAYCRSVNGFWQQRDNLKNKTVSVNKNTQLKVALILFVHNKL